MKSISTFTLGLMLACSISAAALPSYADWKDAREERHEAREDAREARKAQHKANVSAMKGHGFMARWHAKRAANKREDAAEHYAEARRERYDH